MKDNIDKIETELLPEIDAATLRNNMNRITVALTESIRQLVEISKEVETKLSQLGGNRKVSYVDIADANPAEAATKLAAAIEVTKKPKAVEKKAVSKKPVAVTKKKAVNKK